MLCRMLSRGPARRTPALRRAASWAAAGLVALLACSPVEPRAQPTADAESTAQPNPEPVAAPPRACPHAAGVTVRAARAADAEQACAGAARALAFLAQAGLAPPPHTPIDIVERLPGELDGRALGCYLRDTRRILLLSRAAFDATGGWFGEPPDAELYRSAAAHEVAHAVVGCHLGERPLPVPAHEYVAYVTMFATMAPPLRERVLAHFAGRGFASTLQINSIVYVAAPLQFAADAWRHYLKRHDRAAWLRAVVAGDVVQEFPTEGP
jgi:hypothetical protein